MDSSRDPKYLHNLVMHDLHEPVVFHGLTQNWPASMWTPDYLASVLDDKELKIRIGLKEAKQWDTTQWEANCSYETTTLSNFCSWLKQSGDKPLDRQGSNPLLQYDPEKYWCYIDYKYMAQLFEDHPDILQAVKWSDFGFENRDGNQSTIWIGSEGATTPGHYDTYGCNLVAQLFGRKRWHLFPPSQSSALYQTRIPYEESSVFSPINIAHPDKTKYPEFSAATPYIVTLDPGDVLYVPHHWWHFVETIETSISVNSWIEMESDHEDRVHEAITRMLASGILSSAENDGKSKWLNPTEELHESETNLTYLQKAHESLLQHQLSTGSSLSTSAKTSCHSSDEESNTSHNCPVTKNEKMNTATSSDSPLTQKRKQTCDVQGMKDGGKLPDFITPVPCLGHIYQKLNLQCELAGGDNEQQVNKETSLEVLETKTKLRHKSKDCIDVDGAQNFNSDRSPGDIGHLDDVLKVFLESVTDPDVVKHIGIVFSKKMKENI